MEIYKDIFNVGVNDYKIDLFEGQYKVPNGISYNSFLIKDRSVAILNSVEKDFSKKWLNNINKVIGNLDVDYLIIQHMEPDHSGSIVELMNKYPNVKLVASRQAFIMLKNFFKIERKDNILIVKEGDTLTTGEHRLHFLEAKMVHWPEVIFVYDVISKVVFSSDAFGKFGISDGIDDWVNEARRYYFGIVGKYGLQVQNILFKINKLDINCIAPLHGPILKKNISYYLSLYDIWSKYLIEEEGVVINYCSIYGNTKYVVLMIKDLLEKKGYYKIIINDLARCDLHSAISDSFRYSKMILAAPTYNNDIFPFMRNFILSLIERNYRNRIIGFIENGSWAPCANKIMKSMFEKTDNEYFINQVTILSSTNDECIKKINELVDEIVNYK